MLLSEIQYELLEQVRNAHIVDDEDISLNLLTHWINNQRVLWIKRKLDSGQFYNDNLIQEVNISLEFVDLASMYSNTSYGANNINLPSYNSSKRILRSTKQLPEPIELNYGCAVYEVSGIDFIDRPFHFTPFSQLRYCGSSRFTSNQIFVARRNKYWYVKYGDKNVTPGVLDKIVIRMIAMNPLEVPGFNEETDDYPINRDMLVYMKDMIIKNDLRVLLGTNSDRENDSSGDVNNKNFIPKNGSIEE